MEIIEIFKRPFVKVNSIDEEKPYAVLNGNKYIPVKDALEDLIEINLSDVFVTEEYILCDVTDNFIDEKATNNLYRYFRNFSILIGNTEDGPVLEIKIKLV